MSGKEDILKKWMKWRKEKLKTMWNICRWVAFYKQEPQYSQSFPTRSTLLFIFIFQWIRTHKALHSYFQMILIVIFCQRFVSKNEEMEQSLYNQVKSCESERRKQEQNVEVIRQELTTTKKENARLLKVIFHGFMLWNFICFPIFETVYFRTLLDMGPLLVLRV